MNNRIRIALTGLVLGTAAASAQAGDHHWRDEGYGHERDTRYARVVDVDPVFERVRYTVPEQNCWNEERAYAAGPSGAAVIGGAVGAVVGHNIGSGADRPATTFAGALIGAVIGSQFARDERDHRDLRRETVQRCETRLQEHWDRRVVAYRVTYEFRGRRDVVCLAYDPGGWLRMDDARRHG
jgi:uncharacterized protein YcfJ